LALDQRKRRQGQRSRCEIADCALGKAAFVAAGAAGAIAALSARPAIRSGDAGTAWVGEARTLLA